MAINENPLIVDEMLNSGDSKFKRTEAVNDTVTHIFNGAKSTKLVKFSGIDTVQVVPKDLLLPDILCEWVSEGLLLSEGTEVIKHIMWMGSVQPKTDMILVVGPNVPIIKCWDLPNGYEDIFDCMRESYKTEDLSSAYLIKLNKPLSL